MNLTTGKNPPHAVILQFPRRRGRPKNPARLRSDSGTPELVMKRLHGETAEALDLCLERGIVTPRQHWCGIHLRWLYTLRHGAPGVRAIDPTHISGLENKSDDPQWRGAREQEYHEAMKQLAASGHALLVANLCIYNLRPRFLSVRAQDLADAAEHAATIQALRNGLDVLAGLWGR